MNKEPINEMLTWIDKNLSEIKHSLLYGKYFDSILLTDADDSYYLTNAALGIGIVLKLDYRIFAIHFYSGSQKGENQFKGDLPFDLKFEYNQEFTRKKFGSPDQLGGGGISTLYGVTPDWDKYHFARYSLHLQFSSSTGSIDLITIMSHNWQD